MSNDDQGALKLTTTDMAYIQAVFRHSNTRITADWDKVAEEVGVKDAKCARKRFRQISAKHAFGSPGGSPKKASAGELSGKITKNRAPRVKNVKKEESEPIDSSVENAPRSEI